MNKEVGLAFFVYKRPKFTKEVLNSVIKNGFKKIYIFQDGLKKEEDRTDWEEVNRIISGNVDIECEVHVSNHNKGLANSIVSGVSYVLKKHETVIALEDDIVLLDGYREFVTAALEKYEKEVKVFSICGGGFGIVTPDDYRYDAYYSYRMSSGGFATWKNRWDLYERNTNTLKTIKSDKEKRSCLELAGNDIEGMVKDYSKGKIDTWATFWQLLMLNNKGVCVFPTCDYVIDRGREYGGGTNSKYPYYKLEPYKFGEKKGKDDFLFPPVDCIDERIIMDCKAVCDIRSKKIKKRLIFDALTCYIPKLITSKKIRKYFTENKIDNVYIAGKSGIDIYITNLLKKHVSIEGFLSDTISNKCENKVVLWDSKKIVREGKNIIAFDSVNYFYYCHLAKKCNSDARVILLKEIL